MSATRLVTSLVRLGATIAIATSAMGQSYPSKPIHILSPEAGSGLDAQARLIAQGISGPLGQPVVIDNRTPSLLPEAAVKAAPDGYTLVAAASTIWITPLVEKTSYDPVKDFAPLTLVSTSPYILIVHPSLPVKSVKELIALAKARPGQINFASGAPGGGSFLSGELFKALAGVNIVGIPYKGAASGVLAVITGEVQMMFNTAATALAQVKAGKVKGLAVTSSEPTPLTPGVPTVAATGLPGYESSSIVAMLAPAGTPAPIIQNLNQEIVRFLLRPDVKDKFFSMGIDVVASSPDQLGAKIKAEIVKWDKVIKGAESGFKPH